MTNKNQTGFTLVELMLAMTFFSFILLFVVAGFIQINRSYTRGRTRQNIQAVARLVVDDISDNIRNSDLGAVVELNATSPFRLCVGSIMYGYNQHQGNTANPTFSTERYRAEPEEITLVRTTDPTLTCDASSLNDIPRDSNLTTALIDDDMIIQHMSVTPVPASNSFTIRVTVSTDVLSDFDEYGLNAGCKVETGDEYCFASKLETVVTSRN